MIKDISNFVSYNGLYVNISFMLFLFSVSYPVTISVWETTANNWAVQLIKINHRPLCKPIWPVRSKVWLICKSAIANLDCKSLKENPHEMIVEMLQGKWFSGLYMVISTVRQGFVSHFLLSHSGICQWLFLQVASPVGSDKW